MVNRNSLDQKATGDGEDVQDQKETGLKAVRLENTFWNALANKWQFSKVVEKSIDGPMEVVLFLIPKITEWFS